jgi:hypothetical protein
MSETRLALFGKAQLGRDIYRAIREQINACRTRGIEPKAVYVSKDSMDAMHALWSAVARSYDLQLPLGVAGVPMKHGAGLGRNKFMFEYQQGDAGHTLRRGPVDNPMPDNG